MAAEEDPVLTILDINQSIDFGLSHFNNVHFISPCTCTQVILPSFIPLFHMAHQAHALPWQTLADSFKFVHANVRYQCKTNLYPRFKPGQGKQLQHFARVFARVLEDYSMIERQKYNPNYSAPGLTDEILIPDATLSNIRNVVREYMKGHVKEYPEADESPVSSVDRTISTWIAVSQNTECHPGSEDLLTDELLRTLLLYGEMDILFRIAAHPDVFFGKLWLQGGRFAFDLGIW
jgi:hypothetical protein